MGGGALRVGRHGCWGGRGGRDEWRCGGCIPLLSGGEGGGGWRATLARRSADVESMARCAHPHRLAGPHPAVVPAVRTHPDTGPISQTSMPHRRVARRVRPPEVDLVWRLGADRCVFRPRDGGLDAGARLLGARSIPKGLTPPHPTPSGARAYTGQKDRVLQDSNLRIETIPDTSRMFESGALTARPKTLLCQIRIFDNSYCQTQRYAYSIEAQCFLMFEQC